MSGLNRQHVDSIPKGAVRSDSWRWSTVSPNDTTLQADWQSLAQRVALPAIAGPIWSACFYRSFADFEGTRLHVLHRGHRLAAVIPLKRHPGIRSRWTAAVHPHLPAWSCAVDLGIPGIADEILSHLLGAAGAIDLEPMSGEDPLLEALRTAATARGLGVVLDTRHPEAIIDLAGSWEQFATGKAGIKQHLQKTRQLERIGCLTFAKAGDAGEAPDDILQECFELEASGWKGEHGVPMRARADTKTFYESIVREFASAGALSLYTLRLDGRLIAFELGVKAEHRVDALKISYAPEFGRYSPGGVLMTMILRREISEGIVRSRHFGPASEWKTRWTEHFPPLFALRIYGDGVLARAAYGTAPVVYQRLRRSERARGIVHAVRDAAARVSTATSQMRRHLRDAARQVLMTARWLARRESLVILRKALQVPPTVAAHWVLEELGDQPEAVIAVYAALGRTAPDVSLRRRCSTGQRFFVLRDGGEIVATTFVVTGGERFFDECAQGLALPDTSFWLRDVYVVPARRGQRLFGTLLDVLIARRYPETRELLSDVLSDDAISLRAHGRYGFEVCGVVNSWHLARRVMWRSSRVPSLRPATVFAPGQRLFATGTAFRTFSDAHSA